MIFFWGGGGGLILNVLFIVKAKPQKTQKEKKKHFLQMGPELLCMVLVLNIKILYQYTYKLMGAHKCGGVKAKHLPLDGKRKGSET